MMHMMMMVMSDLPFVWKEPKFKHHISVPFVTSQWAGSEKQGRMDFSKKNKTEIIGW